MALDLLGVVVPGRDREGVERVVDIGGVQGGGRLGRRRGVVVVELGEVETTSRFLGGRFGVFRGRASVLLFFGEEGVFLGFFAGRFLALGCLLFPDERRACQILFDSLCVDSGGGEQVEKVRQVRLRMGEGSHFFAVDLAPLLHSASSEAAFLDDSAAAFCAATSAFLEQSVSEEANSK